MTDPQLWIHIGLPKTGSSALESAFQRSRSGLRAHGLDYPEVGEYGGGHVHLAWPLLSEARKAKADVLTKAGADEARELWTTLGEDVRTRGCPRVLVSSEYFSEVDPALLADFAHVVSDDVRILVYLRRQDDLIESGYLQQVKAGLTGEPFRFGGYVEAYDYAIQLERWAAAFGPDSVVARVYDRAAAERGIVQDVCQVLGLEVGAVVDPTGTVNPSTHPAAVELQRLGNQLGLRAGRLTARVSECLQQVDNGGRRSYLTADERREILGAYSASNEEVARRYFGRPDGRLFDPVHADLNVADRSISNEVLGIGLMVLADLLEERQVQ